MAKKKSKKVKLLKFKEVQTDTMINVSRIESVLFLPCDQVLITFKSLETMVIPKHVWDTLPIEVEE